MGIDWLLGMLCTHQWVHPLKSSVVECAVWRQALVGGGLLGVWLGKVNSCFWLLPFLSASSLPWVERFFLCCGPWASCFCLEASLPWNNEPKLTSPHSVCRCLILCLSNGKVTKTAQLSPPLSLYLYDMDFEHILPLKRGPWYSPAVLPISYPSGVHWLCV